VFAQWYLLYGGMQDWNYAWHGDCDLTLELGDEKCPLDSQLERYWGENQEALLAYVEQVTPHTTHHTPDRACAQCVASLLWGKRVTGA
jgi:hypothetical protein